MTKFIQFFVWLFGRLLWASIFRMEVKNRELFEKYPPEHVVFYANHSSFFDAFLVSTNIPLWFYFDFKGFRFLTKRKHAVESWYSPFIRAMGSYPLPKEKRGYENAMPDTIDYVKQGYAVVIFPIPKLFRDINPIDAYPGVSYLADQTKATLIPVRIVNSYAWSIKELFGWHRRVQVIYGAPVEYEDFAKLPGDYREKSRQLMEIVAGLK